jgi:hypothetical protein
MEIVDEIDAVEDMQKMARKTWEERARQRGLVVTSEAGEAPEAGEGQGEVEVEGDENHEGEEPPAQDEATA